MHRILLPLLLLAACVTTQTVTYLPNAEQPRLSLVDGQALLGRFVDADCERLLAAGRATGTAPVTVTLDAAGNATGAELARSSGDSRMDGIIGAVAAQLRLEPAAGGRTTIHASYTCAAGGTGAATLGLTAPTT